VTGRRTNLALLVSLSLALLTGLLAFAIGTPPGRWVVVAHGIVALAILVLSPWKSVVVRRGLRRARRGRRASIALMAAVTASLVAGLLHSSGALVSVGPVSTMQVHVGTALASIALCVYHFVARPVRARRADLGRRQLLQSAGIVAASGATYLAVEGVVRIVGLPGGRRRFTGSHEAGSDVPDEMPVTQWLNDHVPGTDIARWRLDVADREVGYEELLAFDDRVRAILDCTGGWYARQDWQGVWLDRLIRGSGLSIAVSSRTGYGRRYPIEDAGRLLLATRVGGRPLTAGHGFPVRIVAPGRRGFWWVKWVDRIAIEDVPWWRQWPFPPT
jgi:hypothetical protein